MDPARMLSRVTLTGSYRRAVMANVKNINNISNSFGSFLYTATTPLAHLLLHYTQSNSIVKAKEPNAQAPY